MKPTRILLADPCALLRRGIRTLLQEDARGWEIYATAGTGPEAVRKAHAQRPDIVIIDDRMPQLNGLEAAAQIRQRWRRAEILIYSSTTSPQQAARIDHSSVCGALLRSDTPEEFLLALQAVQGHHHFRSRALRALGEEAGESGKEAARLTRRQAEVLCLVALGHSSKMVADKLGICPKTTESHRQNLKRKLRLESVAELTLYAARNGFIEL